MSDNNGHKSARWVAHSMSKEQRDLLMEHACGPQLFVGHGRHDSRKALTRRDLIAAEVSSYDSPSLGPRFTKQTVLTPFGREVCCIVLSEYAEKLARIERSGEETLLRMWRRQCERMRDAIPAMPSSSATPTDRTQAPAAPSQRRWS